MVQGTDKGQGKLRPVDTMRHHRENGWDYKGRAIYHFTLPVEKRYPLFGVLEGESAETAFVRLNPFGRRVYQMLCELAQFYAGKGFALKVLTQKVMPIPVTSQRYRFIALNEMGKMLAQCHP